MAIHRVNVEALSLPDGIYYTLPMRILELASELWRKLLNSGQIVREQEISEAAMKLDCVGFRSGIYINHPLLNENAARVTEEFVSHVNSEDAVEIAAHANKSFAQAHRFGQAYCGWLVSNEEFLSDLDHQREQSQAWIQNGLPQQTFSQPAHAELVTGSDVEAVLNWQTFVSKWRLQGMDTLDLPRPIAPQFTACSPYTATSQEGMQLPAIPDIYPVEGKGLIAKQIESMRVMDDHLADWKTLISSSSRRKKRIDSLGRQYRLQHYWRVLSERYPEKLLSKKDQLKDLFAAYFRLESPDSIYRDLKELGSTITRPLSRSL